MPAPLLVIVNSSVSMYTDGVSRTALDNALDVLRAHTDVEVIPTRNQREIPLVLNKRGNRRLVVAGGDGTLHFVVAELHRRQLLSPNEPLGILPTGAGCDFARVLGIPLDLAAAARVITESNSRTLDLVVDDLGGVVVNTAAIGLATYKTTADEALAATASSQLTSLIPATTRPITELVTMPARKSWRLRILVDDMRMWDSLGGPDGIRGTSDDDARVFMVGIGNGSVAHAGRMLLPTAQPDDGLIDVIVSAASCSASASGSANLDPMTEATTTRIVGELDQQIRTAQGKRVSVLSQDAAYALHVDGEVETGVHGRTWHVLPGAWSVLVPKVATS